jgi:hypothetical protein
VDSVVISILGDLMQPLPPCSAAECCEMDDDAALEVSDLFQCVLIVVRLLNHIPSSGDASVLLSCEAAAAYAPRPVPRHRRDIARSTSACSAATGTRRAAALLGCRSSRGYRGALHRPRAQAPLRLRGHAAWKSTRLAQVEVLFNQGRRMIFRLKT